MPQPDVSKARRSLTEGSIVGALVRLSIPIVMANILATAYQMTDTFWVGRLSAEAVAAVRDFLGMNGTDVTDWKFVDFDEIPTGPWARFGENNTFVQNAHKAGSQVAENITERLGRKKAAHKKAAHGQKAEEPTAPTA